MSKSKENSSGYVIRSKVEKDEETEEVLYWNNDLGWVDRASASVFPTIQYDLPISGVWETR